jgi:putative membrane protein
MGTKRNSYDRQRLGLAAIFLVVWIALAIEPSDRFDWALENILSVLFMVVLVASAKWLPLSRVSYLLIFLFLCLHSLGAHYTYAMVPYDDWFRAIAGGSFNELMGWQRNHFDRLVHFCYGLLLVYPIRELFLRVADVKGFWGYFLPFDLALSTSLIFELIEWMVVELVASDLGMTYLGTQGDVWDAHKDMALAGLGALITMSVAMMVNARLQRDFAREWLDSLRVKHPEPLGEERIARLMKDGR